MYLQVASIALVIGFISAGPIDWPINNVGAADRNLKTPEVNGQKENPMSPEDKEQFLEEIWITFVNCFGNYHETEEPKSESQPESESQSESEEHHLGYDHASRLSSYTTGVIPYAMRPEDKKTLRMIFAHYFEDIQETEESDSKEQYWNPGRAINSDRAKAGRFQ